MIKRMTGKLILISFICLYPVQVVLAAIAQSPLFLTQDVPPIVLLTMGRDHKLYYEAYNDATDLNGDGTLDIGYQPSINYYGYFDSFKCYSYSSGVFVPQAVTSATDKSCAGVSGDWSGDFLNYLTTSRMDAMRKVLYGGYRSTDTTSKTILQRAYIPQDAHSWGKEYTSESVDGYNIANYTPLGLPNTGRRHLFANTTLSSSGNTILRVLQNNSHRIWEWVSKERPVADTSVGTPTDYTVFIEVCKTGLREENCTAYSDGTTTTYKPTGLLQKYGDDDTMAFGLLTGSYENNTSGGVLRKNIASFTDEVDPQTGIFTNVSGIVDTIDKLRISRFQYANKDYVSGWITTRPINEGEAQDWGNPVSEMMYEGLRYFAGKADPTTAFASGVGGGSTVDSDLGLPLPAWQDPYRTTGGFEACAKPIQFVISDINPSYDTDQVPGSSFASFTGDLSGVDSDGNTIALNVSPLADSIWNGEEGLGTTLSIFIGESNGVSDGSPSAKTVSSFSNIRGMAPEEPTKLGGYYSGSVAYFGNQHDLNSVAGEQKVDTLTVALASPLPRFEIPLAVTVDGNTSTNIVTIVPFAKSIAGLSISSAIGDFQPTNQIVDFYLEKLVNTNSDNIDLSENNGLPYAKFRINFEDVEQAADHDMDAISEYTLAVQSDGTLDVTVDSTYAAGSIIQHMGYVISGTTTDGTYLEVRDFDTSEGSDIDYFLDTPDGELPGGTWNDNTHLPLTHTRTFTVSTSASASFIKHDPLWYAAKWGGFKEEEDSSDRPANAAAPNQKPDQAYEWDSDNDGVPDNYFLVTNAGKLQQQLSKAFLAIASSVSSSAAVATNSTRLDSNTKIYQARFDSSKWTGEFLAFDIGLNGVISAQTWDAGALIPEDTAANQLRKIYSYDSSDNNGDTIKGMAFTWSNLSGAQQTLMNTDANGTADVSGLEKGEQRLNYIRGDQSNEESNSGEFRDRTTLMGDVINSDPWFSGTSENFGYSILPDTEGSSYNAFRIAKRERKAAVFFGSNDGMLHAVNASSGDELFTYVPDAVISSLSVLTSQKYGCNGLGCLPHKYFVDGSPKIGDAYFGSTPSWHTVLLGSLGSGGKALFALDVTNPDTASDDDVSLDPFDESSVLWEVSTSEAYNADDLAEFEANLGYTLPQSSVVRLNNGQWAAVVANGYESRDNKAVLFLLDIETGAIIKSFDTGVGSGVSPNGLSTPIAVDIDGNRTADYIYAGDLRGNLWKFDIRDETPDPDSDGTFPDWVIALSGNPLFTACSEDPCVNIQPITAKPQVSRHSISGYMVYFGTGKYYAVNDQIVGNSPQIQNFYGIRDTGSSISGLDVLQEQEILYELSLTDFDVRVTSDTVTDYTGNDANADGDYTDANEYAPKEGWFMKLLSPENGAEGERVVVAPLLRSGRLIFVSMIPQSDPCGWGGTSWLMEMDAESGSRLDFSPIDINGDGVFDSNDLINVGSDADPVYIPSTGVRRKGTGIFKTPGIIVRDGEGGDGNETKVTSDTAGKIITYNEKGSQQNGRQSWNQIR